MYTIAPTEIKTSGCHKRIIEIDQFAFFLGVIYKNILMLLKLNLSFKT